MKKILTIVVVLAIIIGGGYWLTHRSSVNKTITDTVTNKTDGPSQACKVFTLNDAKKVLGDKAVAAKPTPAVTSSSMSVTNCLYTNGVDDPTAVETASILVRAPKNQTGANNNTDAFDNKHLASVQSVSGYGEAAYWSGQYGQLNVLKNQKWVILSIGPAAPSSHTLSRTQALADVVVPKL